MELLDKAPYGKTRRTESGKSVNKAIDNKKRLNNLLEDLEVYLGMYLFANKIPRSSLPDVQQQFDGYSHGILLAIRALQSPEASSAATGGGTDEGTPLSYDSEEYRGSEPAKSTKGGAAPATPGAAPAKTTGGDAKGGQADKDKKPTELKEAELKAARDATAQDADSKTESIAALIARAKKALNAIVTVRQYLQDAQRNVIRLPSRVDSRIEIAVFRTSTGTQIDAGLASLRLVSGAAQRVATMTVESRSRSRFRLDAGLVYSGLVENTYKTGTGADGNRTIQVDATAVPVVPMVFLSYYWAPVDSREACPFASATACPRANLIPTLAVGVPLTRNPLEHFFIGGLWQPMPFFAFTAGAHIGRVNLLRDGFQENAAPPSTMSFSDKDLVTSDFRVSYFAGVVITSDVFVKVLLKIVK